jgi:hypothetical protein
MALTPKDPLLTAAKAVIAFFIGALAIGIAAIMVGIPAALLNQAKILAEMTSDGHTVVAPDFFTAIVVVLVLVAALMALCIWFLLLLRRIVLTVAAGDPFIRDNGDRLSRMGWIALVGELMTIPIGAAIVWLSGMVEDKDMVHLGDDFGVSGGGIILVIVLFILARVFRQGAAMREDLEGTV